VVCDLESNGLDDATRIWCAVCIDIETEKEYVFRPDDMGDFEEFARNITHWCGHNFLSFDRTKLEQFTSIRIPVLSVEDTLILSRLCFIGTRNKHSLESWGEQLGYPKVAHEDWTQFSEEMLHRCIMDARLTLKLRKLLHKCLVNYSSKCVELEHQTQHILNQQKRNGFPLDIEKVHAIHKECKDKADAIEAEIHTAFPPQLVLKEVYTPRVNADGSISKQSTNKIANVDSHRYLADGTVELYEEEVFNLGSPKQIIERLNDAGWKPRVKTKTGLPKLCEENLLTLSPTAPPAAHKLIEWWVLRNRCTVLEGWNDAYNPTTQSIHGTTIGIGAITHRMSHYNPQMANIPSIRSEYGEALRSCLYAGSDDKYTQLGTDISGIQLCILAHYLNDPSYTEAIANGKSKDGTDIHSINMRILQEIVPSVNRDAAKKFIYSMLLGAGGAKLGLDMGATTKQGNAAKEKLFECIPAFKSVQKMCEISANRGYMLGIDGRRVPVKSEHFALSVYLQCGEAVVMKQALVYIDERAKHLDWKQMAVVHDEVQSRCHKDQVEELAQIQIKAIVDAGLLFQLRCPLSGSYKVGRSWKDTH
jgi:DNA polymerase-1